MELGKEWVRVALCLCLFSGALGSYVILIPSNWEYGGLTQICIVVDDPSAPAGDLTIVGSGRSYHYRRLGDDEEERDKTVFFVPAMSLEIPEGQVEFCQDIPVQDYEMYLSTTRLSITGNIAGSFVNFSESIGMSTYDRKTIIQTDKYLYQPNQLVKFRILTIFGPLMNVSTEKYSEVWVTTPSNSRIAQWRDVDNTEGLVHLEMRLVDEPEQGFYRIRVKRSSDNNTMSIGFKVEEYVLPRFEVTIEPPKYVLSRDHSFSFKVCAKYTFGQPVQGDWSIRISNNGDRKCRTVIYKNETFSGCREYEVLASDMRFIDCRINSIYIIATLAEEGTGVEISESSRISISRNPVSFKTLYHDRYMKYNLPYALRVKAERPDGSPASGVPVEMCYDRTCTNATTPSDGILKINIMNFDSRRFVMRNLITRADLYDSTLTESIERYYSPTNSSLLIYAPDGDLKCVPGEDTEYNLQVLFSTPDVTSAAVSVQVKSRDRIQYWATDEYEFIAGSLPIEADESRSRPIPSPGPGTVGVLNIPLRLPVTISPSAWVLVWYIREDGEVVSDSRELSMEKCLPNKVNLKWSAEEAHPGEQNVFTLASEPGSLCSLGVIDKSTALLTPESNALTVDTFFDRISHYTRSWYRSRVDDYRYCREMHSTAEGGRHYYYYTDYVDALKMFDDTGLIVFSDLHLETRPCEKQVSEPTVHRHPEVGYGGPNRGFAAGPMAAPMPDRVHAVAMDSHNIATEMTVMEVEESSNPRTDFPETWLWDLVHVPALGEYVESATMPDTITEWVGKAVCVHPEKGIGLSKTTSVITFTPFFLDLTLPPSIKRGEILPLKISVFNYMDDSLPVTVSLEESSEYEILGEATENLCVSSHEMKVHTIKIRPTIIGDVNITVGAHTDHRYAELCGPVTTRAQRRDALIKPLVVEADGFPREKTWNEYVCSSDVSEDEPTLSWEISAPSAIIEGSDRGWVVAMGDLLALSVENLGHLIRMPYGCGEQNMLNFAPNIFILQYLDATRQAAVEAREKLRRYMQTGYQRQLLYLRHDGSFSAFGNADPSGSTFLTAFVLKSFALAGNYILIDQNNIETMGKWLHRRQNPNGCYESVGTLFNKAMRGGLKLNGTSVPLTAYVVISLIEAGEYPPSTAFDCLLSDLSQDPYIIALKAYAFSLVRHKNTQLLLAELETLVTDEGTSMHWDLRRSSWSSRSMEIETAGYATLAMLKWDSKKYEQQVRKIVKWMSSQRNGWGGFISTQDTVVALQAMAAFESHLDRGDLNAVVNVKMLDLTHTFSVDEYNKLLQQQVTIPSLPTTVHLTLSGNGCVLMQGVLRYNIPDPEPSDAFSLSVTARTARDKNCVTKEINFCTSYLLPDGTSNMVVIEINLVSGYIPEKEDLRKLTRDASKGIKRWDIDGNKISLYVEALTERELCGNIRLIRDIDIENAKPGSLVVYDYYEPEFSLSKSYKLPPSDDCLYAW